MVAKVVGFGLVATNVLLELVWWLLRAYCMCLIFSFLSLFCLICCNVT